MKMLNTKGKVKRRAPRKTKPVDKIKNPLVQKLVNLPDEQKDEIAGTIRGMLSASSRVNDTWRGLFCIPPDSFLDRIIQAFYHRTDIPLEIPFFTGLSHIASHLLKNDVVIKWDGQIIKPSIWTVVLASSGSGKTFAHKAISKWIGVQPDFPECSSSAKFVEELANHPNAFWLRDEFAQLLKALEEQPHMAEIRDILLRLYDGSTISRATKKETITVEDPAMVILGITVLETFMQNVTMESLLDGFSQRFMMVKAVQDNRKLGQSLFKINDHEPRIKASWDELVASVKHKEYELGDDAIAGFDAAFHQFVPENTLPASYFRRIMFTGIKYALLYHILQNKPRNVIDARDMGWAGRLCSMHLKDSMDLLEGHDQSDLQRLIEKCDRAIQKLEQQGKPVNARHLAQSVREVTSAQMANAMLFLCGRGPQRSAFNDTPQASNPYPIGYGDGSGRDQYDPTCLGLGSRQ